jgi:hypothetical protein
MKESGSNISTAVIYGMTMATFVGIFLIPVCYIFVQGLAEFRKKPAQPCPVEVPLTAVHS